MATNNSTITRVGLDLNTESAEQKIERLNREFKELKKLQKELSREPIMNASQLKQVDKELAGIRNEMTKTKKETIDVRKVMNNLSSASLRQLEAAYRKVSVARKNMSRTDPKFKKLEADQKRLKAEIDKTNISFRSQQSLLSRLAGGFSKYSGLLMAAAAAWAGVVVAAKNAIDAYNALDEKFADVMKTTGLTRQEVEALNNELAKINTRTSQQELLDLARVAGKLGITSKEEILGFVRASDQIAVALSEDLGGDIEATVNQLGKLVEIFGISDEFGMEKSLLKIGSTINSLGAIGTSNEAYLVEFGKRLGGIAPMANISIDAIMGMGATLDELGQTSEVSSTAIGKVIAQMFTKTADYARIAGMGIDEFTELLNTDANTAFIKVLEGAKGSAGGFSELANNLTELGLDGARSIGVFAVLANNLDLLQERQAYANEEFEKGTSLTDEFNIKNNTATAKIEKARKEFQKMAIDLGQKLQPAYASIISKASLLLKSLMALVEITIKYRNYIIPLVASITTYIIAIKAAELWSKTLTLRTNLLTKSKLLYNTAVKLLTGQLKLATAAKKAFDTAGKTNVWALAAAAIVGAAIALAKFVANMDKQAKLQKDINDAMKQTSSEYAKQKAELDSLLIIARDTTQSMERRKEAMQQINAISPEYLGNLSLEKINTDEARRAIVAYTAVLEQSAKVRALNNVLVEKQTDKERAKIDKESQSTIDAIEVQIAETEARMADATRELDRLNKEAEIAQAQFTWVGNAVAFGTPDGTEYVDPGTGQIMVAKNGKWELKVIPQAPPPNTPNTPGGSGSSNGTTGTSAEAKKIENEIWEMAQFEESMLIDSGNFYADYLMNRTRVDQSYYSWRKLENKKTLDAEFAEMLKALNEAKESELNSLKKRYAEGEIDKAEFEGSKVLITLASLENELALRKKFGQDELTLQQQILDEEYRLKIKSNEKKQELIAKLKQKQKEDDEKELAAHKTKVDKYTDIAATMGEEVGKIMGDTSKTMEERRKAMAKYMLKTAITELRNMLALYIAQAMAKQVAEKGYIGLITGAGLTAALGVAYGVAMSKLEGYQSGGDTGYGPSNEVAGVVHRKEYVVPEAGTSNPAIARVLRVIEAARRTNKLSTLDFDTLFQMPAIQSAGYASTKASTTSNSIVFPAEFYKIMTDLSSTQSQLASKLDNIEANISFDKLTRAEDRITSAQSKARLK